MRTASVKHVLRADLRLALLWTLAVLGAALLTASGALASTTGGASAVAASAASPTSGEQPTSAGASAQTGASQTGAPSATGGAAASGPQTARKALATWFGPGFYGSTTACGQKMTRKLVGVASRTLPCGTLVQISYGGRQVTVPVVDRGPYSHIGAKWDLTAGTARALQVTETVRIATEIVGSLPNTPTLGEPAETALEQPPAEAPTAAAASTGGAVAR